MPLEGDRSIRARFALAGLAVLLVLTMGFALQVGASDVPTLRVLTTWAGLDDGQGLKPVDMIVITSIRLPRVIMGAMIGAALAVSGAVMQGLFRNPLADPGIVGVSAGASLGAVAIIVLGGTVLAPYSQFAGVNALPFAAFLGGLASTYILYSIATRQRRTSVATMLLAGIALGAFALALTGLLIFVADDLQTSPDFILEPGLARRRHLGEGGFHNADHPAGALRQRLSGARAQRAGIRGSGSGSHGCLGSICEECRDLCDRGSNRRFRCGFPAASDLLASSSLTPSGF